MRRYLETFFRSPWLFLLPLGVLLLAGAALSARAATAQRLYTSEAIFGVNLDPTQQKPTGERPGAQHHAELLGELIESDAFVIGALQRTSLAEALTRSADEHARAEHLRRSWRHTAAGTNTVHVSYRCTDAPLCAEVVAAVIGAYRDEVIGAQVSERKAAVDFFERQTQAADQRLRGLRETDAGYTQARDTYEALAARLTNARLEEGLARQARQSEFRLLSAPRVSSSPSRGLVAIILPLLGAFVLGVLLSAGLVAALTWLDRTPRSAADVRTRHGLPVVAVLPHRKAHRESARTR